MPAPILGVILAGGLARRMGGADKPLLKLGDRSLLARAVERLAPQCAAGLVLSANGDPARFSGFPGPILADAMPGNPGPLAGILAALDHAAARDANRPPSARPDDGASSEILPHSPFVPPRHEGEGGIGHVVSVSGDAPFLPRDLVARLTAGGDVHDTRIVLASSGGRRHHTVALWPVGLRHALRAALVERDERRVGAFIAHHGFVAVEWPTEPVDPFLNVNTPGDLAGAEAVLARMHAFQETEDE